MPIEPIYPIPSSLYLDLKDFIRDRAIIDPRAALLLERLTQNENEIARQLCKHSGLGEK